MSHESSSAEQNISSLKSSSESSSSLEKNDELTMRHVTNALIYCKSLLQEENLITNTPPEQISAASIVMGEEIFKEIIFMLQDRKIIADEDLILSEETDVLNKKEYIQKYVEFLLFQFVLLLNLFIFQISEVIKITTYNNMIF